MGSLGILEQKGLEPGVPDLPVRPFIGEWGWGWSRCVEAFPASSLGF